MNELQRPKFLRPELVFFKTRVEIPNREPKRDKGASQTQYEFFQSVCPTL